MLSGNKDRNIKLGSLAIEMDVVQLLRQCCGWWMTLPLLIPLAMHSSQSRPSGRTLTRNYVKRTKIAAQTNPFMHVSSESYFFFSLGRPDTDICIPRRGALVPAAGVWNVNDCQVRAGGARAGFRVYGSL